MPRKIVDFSARSEFIREEPWDLHFWESSAEDVLAYLRNPRKELARMGIELPEDCRIETVIENHDWIGENSNGLAASNGPIIICNVGGGNVAKAYYRVTMYGHLEEDIAKFEKRLLHSPDEQARDLGDIALE